MAKKVYVFLADGFEEIEGLTVVDLLRRAQIDTTTVSVTGAEMVHGAHGIDVKADVLFAEGICEDGDAFVLPGGMPGTTHLRDHEGLQKLLKKQYEKEKYMAAICAAPGIFGALGFLEGREACSYPTVESQLTGARVTKEPVTVSNHIITSRGMGTAISFSLELIKLLTNEKKSREIADAIIY